MQDESRISILFINLERRNDRRLRLEASIPSATFKTHRIDAIDARSTDFELSTNLLNDAETACWKSHQKAYRFQFEANIEYALVLEDDADFEHRQFTPELLAVVCEFMATNDIKVFQLGYLTHQYRWWEPSRIIESVRAIVQSKNNTLKMTNGSQLRFVKDSFRSGAHAYLIHIDAAEQLVKLNDPAVFPADDFLSLLAARSVPHLAFARSRASLIQQRSRRNLKLRDLDSDIEPSE